MTKLKTLLTFLCVVVMGNFICLAADNANLPMADMVKDYINKESNPDKKGLLSYFDFDYFMPGMMPGNWDNYTDDEKEAAELFLLGRIPPCGAQIKWKFAKLDKSMGESVVTATDLGNLDNMYTFKLHKTVTGYSIYEITKSDSYSETDLIGNLAKQSFIADGVRVFTPKNLGDGKPVVLVRPTAQESEIYGAALSAFPKESEELYQFYADLPLEAQRTLVKGLCEQFSMSQKDIEDILTRTDYWYMDGGS